jgi:hypothetical protein
MNVDIAVTNKDCEKCCCSRIIDISSDYEEHKYSCSLGYSIEGQFDTNKKGCGLEDGHYFLSGKMTVNKIRTKKR